VALDSNFVLYCIQAVEVDLINGWITPVPECWESTCSVLSELATIVSVGWGCILPRLTVATFALGVLGVFAQERKAFFSVKSNGSFPRPHVPL
jgi:hypothetical protein